MTPKAVTIDGNEAAASVAFRLSEVIAIYPSAKSQYLAASWAICDYPASMRIGVYGGIPGPRNGDDGRSLGAENANRKEYLS